jgi:hypothetical protein
MTSVPRPADPAQTFVATYDAWNRLVKLTDGTNTVAEYVYDGPRPPRSRWSANEAPRTVKRTYTAGCTPSASRDGSFCRIAGLSRLHVRG